MEQRLLLFSICSAMISKLIELRCVSETVFLSQISLSASLSERPLVIKGLGFQLFYLVSSINVSNVSWFYFKNLHTICVSVVIFGYVGICRVNGSDLRTLLCLDWWFLLSDLIPLISQRLTCLREYAQMMRQTPIVSHLWGFTVALNNQKINLVKFHFRNPLINIHQKSLTFLIFCVVAFNHCYSRQHESLSQTCCCVCALTQAPARTHKLRVQFGIFCSI